MRISEARAAELKTWVTRKLEDISDADSDVLADYVLALARADIPEADLRLSVIENLEDFLKNNTASFVDELLKALRLPPKPTPINPTAPQFIPSVASGSSAPFAASPNHQSLHFVDGGRKRPFQDSQGPTSPTRHRGRNDRAMKHARGGVPVRGPSGRVTKDTHQRNRQGIPFDPQQAAAALWTLESMGIPVPQLSLGLNAMPGHTNGWSARGRGKQREMNRCKDYDTIGICQRGANCPYLHDANQIIMPLGGEFAPPIQSSNGNLQTEADQHPKGVASRGTTMGQRRRADISQIGPSRDASMSTIVIENIPKEYLNEASVRGFFTTFGRVQDVQMQPASRLAIVNYESHDAAAAAYESPKVIFDNRFVKVYWHNPRQLRSEDGTGSEDTTFDREAFERGLEEAQKRFNERKALKDETNTKVAEIQEQREEIERKREHERQKLLAKIREKRPSDHSSVDDTKSSTEHLRAKLKWLEEEAESLGLQPEPWTSESTGYGRGRGLYRGRGRYGARSSRGAYRGRGSLPGGGAYNIDNRSITVKVDGVEFDSKRDEALRQHLINVGEFSSIEASPSGTSQTIVFKDRHTAERFFYGTQDVPGVGKLEFTWVQGAAKPHRNTSTDMDEGMGDQSDNASDRDHEVHYGDPSNEARDMDYDVAEDEER